MDELVWLQDWYHHQCDGDWGHEFGVLIETLDNPGWRVAISTAQTDLEERALERVEVQRDEDDWYFCWVGEAEANRVQQMTFHIACGPNNLTEGLQVFRAWATEPSE